MRPITQRLLAVALLALAFGLAIAASRTPERTWTVGAKQASYDAAKYAASTSVPKAK